ncbi:hypothetical protein A1O1_05424 [Capronia coronata CBS 617.96]|uniref:Oxidoreductase NAD-binding domain-containing protein 1 n=1 Tax=Capronia coronata CBS 617.96 TaxID=1182541 RepID=W9Z1W0_9EURO|nr:uncharacterized protein A1O1_05424 [Capronia coronata CBS 617.96]EXJ88494.1 hypothetical protein A1O1_05424 [Capronia coronata CBS 617.96]
MATLIDSIPHIIRTAEDPRQEGVWTARLSRIDQVNSKIRVLRLSLPKDGRPLRHLPGQYVDLYIPNIDVVGGFTITSPPQASSQSQEDPHIELAIQSSPTNPPAAYLWRSPREILDSAVSFKVGGNFVYPPQTLGREQHGRLDRLVLIAGGVGINPIMSMVSAMHDTGVTNTPDGMPRTVRVLYSSRREKNKQGGTEEVLFERRLKDIAQHWSGNQDVNYKYTFFETGEGHAKEDEHGGNMATCYRRINHDDLFDAIGPENGRGKSFVYVCGLPTMTDEFVALLKQTPGMDGNKVLCEKWW